MFSKSAKKVGLIIVSIIGSLVAWILDWAIIIALVVLMTNYPAEFGKWAQRMLDIATWVMDYFHVARSWQVVARTSVSLTGVIGLFMMIRLAIKIIFSVVWKILRKNP